MKPIVAVFNSNLVNRQGSKFPVPVLESILEQGWNHPHPSNIGHDAHRPMGYSETLALHLQPGLARLIGRIWTAENDEDAKLAGRIAQRFYSDRIAEADPEMCERLRSLLEGHLSANAVVRVPSCVALQDEGLARRAFPAIFASADKDGLIPLKSLRPVLPGVFQHGELLLFAHQYFRRSLSRFNTLNEPFLKRFQALGQNEQLDLRIALDEDLVGLADTLLQAIELQHWWGPKFSDELPKVPLGVAQHGNDELEKVYNGVSRTEFWWYEQNERTFECEEVLDRPSLGMSRGHFGCRFVHSILDPKSGRSKHLDGAVRMYDEEAMLARIEVNLMHAGRRSRYTKLWRADQELDVPLWKALISDYFRDNHLVGEYLGGKEDADEPPRPRALDLDPTTPSVATFAPCTMARGDGVRIAISYHPIAPSLAGHRVIEPANELGSADGSQPYVEECTIDLVKLLRRRGETVEWPKDVVRLAFEDFVFGLPLIAHCDAEAVVAAQRTQDTIAEYCAALSRKGEDRMLGYHLGVRLADRDIIFSFAGHVDDLDRWLRSDRSRLPASREVIGQWADAAIEELSRFFPNARDVPPLDNMFEVSGTLSLERKVLAPEGFELLPDPEDGSPLLGLTNHPDVLRAMPLIKEGRITVAPVFRVTASECDRCGAAYDSCDCIKLVDDGVGQMVTECDLAGFFWTDRSARQLEPARPAEPAQPCAMPATVAGPQ